MNRLAAFPPRMDEPAPPSDARRAYEELLSRAMRYAERLVPRDQAFEVAHEVAVELLGRHPGEITGTLIYMRVTSRLRNSIRASQRRAALDGAWIGQRGQVAPSWADAGGELEARELRDRIAETLLAMPPAMREAFVLVREEELSYKEAAARLGVGVGTVHTQLSRANALLRECVERYRAAAGSSKRKQP